MDKYYYLKYFFALSILIGIGSSCCNSDKDEKTSSKDNYQSTNETNTKSKEKEIPKDEDVSTWTNKKAVKIYKYCQSKGQHVTKEDCEHAAEKKYWIGMNVYLLVASWGKPNTINPSNYGSGVEYQYCWDNYTPSCFYCGEDYIVTSYN